MGDINKRVSLVFILLINAPVLFMAKSIAAQSIPKPSVPEFTIQLADHSYDVLPTTTTVTGPYSGKTITTTTAGYHAQNITIDLTIVSQSYSSTINGNTSYVYFNMRIKGHFEQYWKELCPYYDKSPIQSMVLVCALLNQSFGGQRVLCHLCVVVLFVLGVFVV